MKKTLSGKMIGAIIGGVAVVAAVVVAVVMMLNKDDSYRTIKVYDVTGTATVTRNDKNLKAVNSMFLESGDKVRVDEASLLCLKMDEDKYLMAEENTTFSLEATGDSANSKTRLNLEYGKISNDIRQPLSSDSVYEVETPNAVMAVRGTFFIVEYFRDENGEYVTRIITLQGKVEAWVKNADGKLSEDSIMITAGSQEEIRTYHTEEEMEEALKTLSETVRISLNERAAFSPTPVVYEELTRDELIFFYESIQAGLKPVNTTKEYVYYLIYGDEPVEESSESVMPEESSEAQPSESEEPEESSEASEEPSEEVSTKPSKPSQPEASEESSEAQSSESSQPEETTPAPATPEESTPTEEVVTYTVTFLYDGATFATEKVNAGELAVEPQLMPTESGNWDFDFSTAISADTTVNWVSKD